MSGQEISVEEFLSHSNRGAKRKYLKNWKDEPPHSILTWLSTLSKIVVTWRHPFPEVVPRQDKRTGATTKEVWGGKYNCFEDQAVLQRQGLRDRQTGERDTPPQRCPFCLMIEYVRDQVESGKLDWTTPVFKFEATDSEKDRILHAGGLYNAYGRRDITKEEKKELRDAGIYIKEAWNENMMAKMQYIFSIVNHEHPEDGLQVAEVPGLLGDKVKSVIAKAMKSKKDRGNPMKFPYAIEWVYNPAKDIPFQEKYDATAMEDVELTSAIEKLIRNTDPPDLKGLLQKANPKTILARFQQYSLIDLPFESFFENIDMDASDDEDEHDEEEEKPKRGRTPEVNTRQAAPPAQARRREAPKEPELVLCANEKCNKKIAVDAPKCKYCGLVYDVDGDDEESESDPKPVAKAKKATPAAEPAKKSKRAPVDEDEEEAEDDDQIPF